MFHHAESHGLMDFNYTNVKLDLSGFTVKGRREEPQMVFGSDTEGHIWWYVDDIISVLQKRKQPYMI